MSLASKLVSRPVKWVEDRLEHLIGATSATARKASWKAAITEKGELLGLKIIQYDDCGGYLRAPNQHLYIECMEIYLVHIK